jgi:prepilin-type N-terminal cleavage/methylation domain-containing protein
MKQRGLALIELLFAVALAAIISAALGSLTSVLLQTQSYSHASHELANQARFALNRVTATLRSGSAAASSATSPQLVVTVGTRTLSYSFDAAAARLSETDSASGATSVIADNVSAFNSTLATRIATPANYAAPLTVGGTLAAPVVQVGLTLGGNGLSIPATAYTRVGGGL